MPLLNRSITLLRFVSRSRSCAWWAPFYDASRTCTLTTRIHVFLDSRTTRIQRRDGHGEHFARPDTHSDRRPAPKTLPLRCLRPPLVRGFAPLPARWPIRHELECATAMPICFVIQPFDRGPYDERFEDIVGPAIRAAGFEPYRVDTDAGVVVPIDQIESVIRDADACLADITTDNPNVWFELGLAIAARKPTILIAQAAVRSAFPFDVRHRFIIGYRTEAPRDFQKLANEITDRLRAVCGLKANAQTPAHPVRRLTHDELVRDEREMATALIQTIMATEYQKDAFFSRLLRVCEIKAHRAYENLDYDDRMHDVHEFTASEAAGIAGSYGLEQEWHEWFRRRQLPERVPVKPLPE